VSERPNIPVPDELALVRAEIKRLQERESELRRLLILHADLRTGADWLAEIKVTQRDTLDTKELRACHPQLVSEFTHAVPVEQVVLSGITEDGEIVSARRKRAMS
jgi:hypothetical protein